MAEPGHAERVLSVLRDGAHCARAYGHLGECEPPLGRRVRRRA